MKLVTYNIQYGRGKDKKIDIKRVLDEISGADVIALQELDRYWRRTDYADQVDQITSAMPDYYWVYGAGIDLHADQHSDSNRGIRRQFGNLLLSRYPIVSSRNHLLPKYGSVDAISIQRSALEATIECQGQLLRFYSVHLTHLSAETRQPQIDRLLHIHRNAVHEGFPVSGNLHGLSWEGIPDQTVPYEAIMMGDFNCQPDSKEYQKIVGPVSDYGGHIVNPAGFVDCWTHCGHDKKAGTTSYVNGKPVRLDYCFVSTSLRDRISSCHVDEQAQGSDHQPVWVEVEMDI